MYRAYLKTVLLALLLVGGLLPGCGSSNQNLIVANPGIEPQPVARGSILLRFEDAAGGVTTRLNVDDHSSESDVLRRLPPSVASYQVSVFTGDGSQTLYERTFGRVAEAVLEGLPQGDVFLRILFLDGTGATVGYRDLLITVGTSATIDAIIPGSPGTPGVIRPQLAFRVFPGDTQSGEPQPVEVVALGNTGFLDTTFDESVRLSAQGAGTLSGDSASFATQGVVRFSVGLTGQGQFTLTAAADGFGSSRSSTFLVAPAPPQPTPTPPATPTPVPPTVAVPTSLSFALFPNEAIQFNTVSPAIVVEVLDQFGKRISVDGVEIELSLIPNPQAPEVPAARLIGTLRMTAQAGLATFSQVIPERAGTYRILASAAGLQSATSAELAITAPPLPPAPPVVKKNGRLYLASNNESVSVSGYANAAQLSGNNPSRATNLNGAATLLNDAESLALDVGRDLLYVTNYSQNRITVFANPSTATGNLQPTSTFTQSAGGNFSNGIALDSRRDRLYVGCNGGNVTIFDNASSLSGAVTPVVISGFSGEIAGIAVDPANDRLFVTANSGSSIDIFDNASSLTGTLTRAAIVSRTVTGLPAGSEALFLDTALQRLYVVQTNIGNQVLVFSNVNSPSFQGGVAPTAILAGSNTTLNTGSDTQVFVDTVNDELYTRNTTTVFVFSGVSQYVGNVNVAPSRVITGLSEQFGLIVDITRD